MQKRGRKGESGGNETRPTFIGSGTEVIGLLAVLMTGGGKSHL